MAVSCSGFVVSFWIGCSALHSWAVMRPVSSFGMGCWFVSVLDGSLSLILSYSSVLKLRGLCDIMAPLSILTVF